LQVLFPVNLHFASNFLAYLKFVGNFSCKNKFVSIPQVLFSANLHFTQNFLAYFKFAGNFLQKKFTGIFSCENEFASIFSLLIMLQEILQKEL